MPHDVFISYSSKDRPVAETMCSALEQSGVRCWMAPRDIPGGVDYGEAIIDAITNSRVMVLVFSASANDSEQVKREVQTAVDERVPIVPVRIENVKPTRAMRYFLGPTQWMDALPPPIEGHLARLISTTKMLLGMDLSGPQAQLVKPPSQKAWTHYEKGLKYYSGTSRDEMGWAEEEFRAALQDDDSLCLAHVGLADVAIFRYMSYFDRSAAGLEKAEHYCRKALDTDPECCEAYRSLGRMHMMRREFDRARQCFSRAIELNPSCLAAHIALGWCGIEAHDLVAAERAGLAARAIAEDNLEAILLLALTYCHLKDYDRSIGMAREAIDLDRKLGRGYYELAMAQRALGQTAEARTNFERSLAFHGDPNTPLDLGVLELFERNWAKAIRMLKTATREGTFAFLAHYYLGFASHLTGKHEEAKRSFRKSAQLSERLAERNALDPYPRIVGAMAAGALGDATRARDLLDKARTIDPRDGLVAFYGACALSWFGDPAETRDLLNEALALPRSPSRIEASVDPHFNPARGS